MADNTTHYECIVTLKGGLDLLFAEEPRVFVAGDLLWYPAEGRPDIRRAPNTMVVFGRPKGHRSPYRQWEEENIASQVVSEIWSPHNREIARMVQQAQHEAEEQRRRAERLAAKLREPGIDPEQV